MVELQENERIIMQEDCSEDGIGSGYLTLTNQRLIFEIGQSLILTFTKKITEVALDISLKNITNVETEGWLAKKIVVEVSESTGSKLYKFGVFRPGKWRDTINAATKSAG